MVTIATFWLSTALTELFSSQAIVTAVKTAIPWGFLLLIPALMAAGGSGFALAKGRRGGLVGAKSKRMPLIAANGILILVPSALFLASKARVAEFDTGFYAVQAFELAAGAVNIALLGPQSARRPQDERPTPPPASVSPLRSAERESRQPLNDDAAHEQRSRCSTFAPGWPTRAFSSSYHFEKATIDGT